MVKRPSPISLRSAEVIRHARYTLRRLDAEDQLNRRVKWQATKALIAVRELSSIGAPRIEKMLAAERARWRAECERVKSFLEKIKDQGV